MLPFISLVAASTSLKRGSIGLIIPQTNDGAALEGIKWKQVACASLIAVQHVREGKGSIVPGLAELTANINLTATMYDSGYRVSPGIRAYRKSAEDGGLALVGAARSAVSLPLAQLAAIDHIPQCSYWSSSPTLSDSMQYPYFSRTYPSDAITTIALTRLIANFGWKNIGVIHVNDDYANAYARGMRDNAADSGMTVRASASFTANGPATYDAACASLKAAGVSVIVAVVFDPDFPGVLQACRNLGLWGEGYVWISSDGATAAASFEAAKALGHTPEEAAALFSGMLNFYSSPEASEGYARFQQDWASHADADCAAAMPFFDVATQQAFWTTDAWNVAAYAYDCVVAMAAAMSQAVDPSDGTEVTSHFRNIAFSGASGAVAFDANGDREANSIEYVLHNWVADGAALRSHFAGTISLSRDFATAPEDVTCRDALCPRYAITWAGGLHDVPIDQTTVESASLRERRIVFIAFGVLLGVLAVALTAVAVTVVVRRILLFRRMQREHDSALETRVRNAIESARLFNYPAVYLRATDFIKLGSLSCHEELRERGLLVVRDTIRAIITDEHIIFFSHQWTSFKEPDHSNKQYEVMVAAVHAMCALKGWDLDNVLVWCDFVSIPQKCRGAQQLAIQSLSAYAANASAFIIAAPTVPHEETGETCCLLSYQGRMWCRAEQLSHMLGNSASNIFVSTKVDGAPEEVCQKVTASWAWTDKNLHVFDGRCSVAKDRFALVRQAASKWPAWWGLSRIYPPRAPRSTPEGLRLPSTPRKTDPAPHTSPRGRNSGEQSHAADADLAG